MSLEIINWQTEKDNILYYPRELMTTDQPTVILEILGRKKSHQIPGLLPDLETKKVST